MEAINLKVVIASNNKYKIKEFKEMLKNYEVFSQEEIGFFDDVKETGTTFLENALIKARAINKYLKDNNIEAMVIADDSGLCVDALNGAPGVYSARYAGNHDNKANREKLIKELSDKTNRDAHYECSLVKMNYDGTYKVYTGQTYGRILDHEEGDDEFGFNKIFYSNDLKKTFASSSIEERNEVSHRGRAMKLLLKDI